MAGRSDTRPPASPAADSGEPPDPRHSFLLRLPKHLMDDLRGWATQEVRSLNGQIEYLLREAVAARRKRGSRS